MIEEGDKIIIGLSGGKDSITLAMGLKALQRFYPKKFEILCVSINPGFEFFNSDFLKETCNKIGVPFIEEKSHIKEIVFDIRNEKNPCSLCANLRRGILNSVAIREGCNKIALGHNEDDVLETIEVGFSLLKFLLKNNLNELIERYKLETEDVKQILDDSNLEENEKSLEILHKIGRKRGAVISGGDIDEEKTAKIILDDFRSGKIGKITLEKA